MAIANPRIHIICGICGCKDELSYTIEKDYLCHDEGGKDEKWRDAVVISCENCGSITGLEELIKECPCGKG